MLIIMNNRLYLIVFILIIFASCTKENSTKEKYSYSDFATNLTSDMNYSAIVAIFGEPSKDIGSGIHIYVYILSDSTEVWIGYTDKILYARHLDKNHFLIENLI